MDPFEAGGSARMARACRHAAMTRTGPHRTTRTAHHGYAVAMRLRCFLGHGASGTSASMAPFVAGCEHAA